MPAYSDKSLAKLETCHLDLQTVFKWVIKYFDNTIIFGERSPAIQFELYKKGRELVNGVWVIKDISKVVTYKDGYEKLSKHNIEPLSEAIDVAPYPIEWNNKKRFIRFGSYVEGVADLMFDKKIIDHRIIWGADWDKDTFMNDHNFVDLPHFQVAI